MNAIMGPAPALARAGRPLRAFSLLWLILALWLVVRLPVMEAEYSAARASLGPPLPFAAETAPAVPASPDPAPVSVSVPADAVPAPAPPPYPVPPPAYPPAYWQQAYAPAYAPAYPPAYVPAARPFELPLPASLPPGYVQQPAPQAPGTAAAPRSPSPPSPAAGDFATAAYARLAEGDRRGAVRLFDLALAADDGDPRRKQWLADRNNLLKRWSLIGYSLVRRETLPDTGIAASPVLGGGQSGATLAYTINPLGKRPIAAVARFSAASGAQGLDNTTGQAAFGVRWQFLPGVSVSAERLVALGPFARNDWTVRLAAGADGHRGRLHWSGYGEAGVLGNGDAYGGAQAMALTKVVRIGKANFEAGAGIWGGIQTGPQTIGRLDIGPTLATQVPVGRASLAVSADWRQRVAGQAAPDSGPALTLSTAF